MFKYNSKVYGKFTQTALQEIFSLFKKALTQKELKEIEIVYPPEKEFGDFSAPCFPLARFYKKSPPEIAQELTKKIKPFPGGVIKKIKAEGPYLNFFVDSKKQAEIVLGEIEEKQEKIGRNFSGRGKKVLIEYVSPNTNKPLHLGHGRNAVLGWSLAEILKENGYKVVKVCLINDRGIHICKSMLAYLKKGKGLTPQEVGIKGDHFVGDYYVLYEDLKKGNHRLEEEAYELLQKWEEGDQKTRALWRQMTDWVLEGIKTTFQKIGIDFDKFYFESQFYTKGKEIVQKGLQKGLFKEKDGAVVAELGKYNLPDKVLLRSDGTSLYITQDIYLTYLKYKDYKPDKIVHVIAAEQDLAQKQLFAILDILGFPVAKYLYHLSYGMVNVEGGKLKSRSGVKVDIDTLLKELGKLASLNIRAREEEINEEELEERSEKIALAALKYYLLYYNPKTTINFHKEKALSFEGRTGPYLLYSYARAVNILKKAGFKEEKKKKTSYSFKAAEEQALLDLLAKFSGVIKEAGDNYDPSLLAKYLYELSKSFHEFYHACPVVSASPSLKNARLYLVKSFQIVLRKGLKLLGIKTLEKM